MQVSIPCPQCNWSAINGDFVEYNKDGMLYRMRCTHCNCLFDISFMVDLKVTRQGAKNG